MSFFKIQDPNKRDEIVREMIERRKKIYQDRLNENISEANFQTDLSKLYKPLIESNEKMIKSIADKERRNEKVQNKLESTIFEEPNNLGDISSFFLKKYNTRFVNDVRRNFEISKIRDKMVFGKTEMEVDENDIIVGGERYKGTSGL